MKAIRFEAEVLVSGQARGPALVLEDTLSFWGGFDPATGEIIDIHHPQFQQRVTGQILFIPESRGSAGTPGGIAETLRNKTGPLAFVLGQRDVNIGVGVLVANRLYDLQIPVLQLSEAQMKTISSGSRVSIDLNGAVSVET